MKVECSSAVWLRMYEPVQQPDCLVDGDSAAAFLRLTVPLVTSVHVFFRKVAAQEVKVGRIHSDQSGIQHVLYLQDHKNETQSRGK